MAKMKKAKVAMLTIPPQETVRYADINRAPYNPRVPMPPEKMRALKTSLRRHGLVLNLVVQRKADDGTPLVLIGGHQRCTAMEQIAKEDGFALPEEINVVVLDVTDVEAKKLNIALNKIESDFDPYKLGEVFASIRQGMTVEDIEMVAFTVDEIDQSIALVMPPDDAMEVMGEGTEDVGAFAKSITLTVEFDTVDGRDKARDQLKELAASQGCKPGKIMAQALKAYSIAKPPKTKPKKGARR